ncbi:MAG: MBL fold metallo-hydrolase [Candidatus Peregrinibacteria bacterium]|nr:MBL fold metallo-hydrolase [Candidatus Peregrinibacteria bacterium]MDZ4244415.1 MBL fold metallo-hydrolase [Candidatus Gracilibacteria bacterium]
MDITYYGDTSFHLKGKKVAVALNPKKGMPKFDLALFSSDKHEDAEANSFIDWPGEYEVREVLVHGLSVSYGNDSTIIYNFELDDVKVLYLPNLDHVLDEAILEKLGDADVVFLPVGSAGVLDAKTASKVYEEVDPKIVIPMQHSEGEFGPVGDFLKEVGKVGLEFEPSLKVEKSSLPVDSTEFHVLENHV